MLEFCPLCIKNGQKKRTMLTQINLHEAVWLCESSQCPWPFGSQDFTFVSRKVGEMWSSEWEVNKPPAPKSSESFQISLNELGLDTPPVTPGNGNEVVHKDLVFGDSTSLVTSLNLSTNNVIQTKVNSENSKSHTNKSKHSHASESGSIKSESTGIRVSGEIETSKTSVRSNDPEIESPELLNSANHSLKDDKTVSKFENGFSLSEDMNFESLDRCVSSSQGFVKACDTAEALTQSVFNTREPSRDNLSIHESTVKCKKWLSDNTKSAVLGDHCYMSSESKKLAVETRNVPVQVVNSKQQRSSAESLNSAKILPKIKSIEKTNVQLARVVSARGTLRDKNNSASATTKNTESIVFGDPTEVVIEGTEETTTSTNSNESITASDEFALQDRVVCQNKSETCKIENTTLVIDGMYPINLSYEIPSFLEQSVTVPYSTNCKDEVKVEVPKIDLGREPVVDNPVVSINVKVEPVDCQETKNSQSTTSRKTETRRQSIKKPLKRTISKLAKYEGFNFGALKKSKANAIHCDENIKSSLSNVPSPDNDSGCSDLTWTSETSCATTTTVDSKVESVVSRDDSNSKSTLTSESFSSTLSSNLKSGSTFNPENDQVLEPNLNLDLVLDELMLSSNEDLTKSFGDDWLVSLLD